MVDEDIGMCATCQKWLMFLINVILFIVGVTQIGIACYVQAGDGEGLEFASELLDGNDSANKSMLAVGILFTLISLLGCVGFKKESRFILWLYVIILFLMIGGQAMVVAVITVSVNYEDSIFESLWKDLSPETIADIEVAYECCSFNGNSTNTWTADAEEWEECENEYDFSPMESCWSKFDGMIEENYNMVKAATAIFLGCQMLIYFSSHYVLQSIAKAEGVEEAKNIEIVRHGEKR